MTVEEFLKQNNCVESYFEEHKKMLIAFAKFHVKAALNKASCQAKIIGSWGGDDVSLDEINTSDIDGEWMLLRVNNETILNCYKEID